MKLLYTMLTAILILSVAGSPVMSHGAELETAVFYVA
jgi:hypothetical protein